ncbi:hypothetical protein RSAG8_02427, partial [Rhizoctonia solani AG-8 WAC10335]
MNAHLDFYVDELPDTLELILEQAKGHVCVLHD